MVFRSKKALGLNLLLILSCLILSSCKVNHLFSPEGEVLSGESEQNKHQSQKDIKFKQTDPREVKFFLDQGIRKDFAAQSYVVSKDDTGKLRVYEPKLGKDVFLTYKDTTIDQKDSENHTNPSKISTSTNGLLFNEGKPFQHFKKPGIKLPRPIKGKVAYRQFFLTADGMHSATSLNGGETYEIDEGIRYKLSKEDFGSVGYYDYTVNFKGEIVLLYIGAMKDSSSNIRLAISKDNGSSFQLVDRNPLGDRGDNAMGLDHRDPRITKLKDGRLRLFTMVQGDIGAPIPGERALGEIHSFTSHDGGHRWKKDKGIRLKSGIIGEMEVWSLNDPHVIELSDGRFRMYITARVLDKSSSDESYKEVIISLTTR